MEESEKKKYYEELTRKCKTEKGGLEKKQTLQRKLNKEKIQKKGKRREKCKTRVGKPRHVRMTNTSWPYTWHSTT